MSPVEIFLVNHVRVDARFPKCMSWNKIGLTADHFWQELHKILYLLFLKKLKAETRQYIKITATESK